MKIRVATYNIHGCMGMHGRMDCVRTIAAIRALDCDIVALQEVEDRLCGNARFLAQLERETKMHVISCPTFVRRGFSYGNALLTRFVPTSVERIELPMVGKEPRTALSVCFSWPDSKLHLVATHFGLRPRERRIQVQYLLGVVERHTAHTFVLLGDLNEWFLWGRPERWLRRHFARMPRLPTFPSVAPVLALDRIWVHPRAALQAIYTSSDPLHRRASDHLPLIANLDA